MSTSGAAEKCGFTECETSNPAKYFLVSTYAASTTASQYEYTIVSPGLTEKYSYKENDVTIEDPIGCTNSTVYSGNVSYTLSGDINGSVNYSGSLDAVTGEWNGDGDLAEMFGSDLLDDLSTSISETGTNICTSTTSGNTTTGSGSYSSESILIYQGSLNATAQTGLSKEFTDDMLMQKLKANIPPYPPDVEANWSPDPATAFYTIDANHFSCTGGKMKYKFFLCAQVSMAKGQTFKLTWQQVTTYPNNTAPLTSDMSEQVTGNGDPSGMYSSIHEVDVPGTPSSITETGGDIEPMSQSPPGSSGN